MGRLSVAYERRIYDISASGSGRLLDFGEFYVKRSKFTAVWIAPKSDLNGFVTQIDNQLASLVLRCYRRTRTFEFHQVRLD